MQEVKDTAGNQKPEKLSDQEAWIKFDKDKNRVEMDVSTRMGAPLLVPGPENKKFLIVVLDLDQETLSYGILEKGRQAVQNEADAKKVLEYRKALESAKIRQTLKGGVANA